MCYAIARAESAFALRPNVIIILCCIRPNRPGTLDASEQRSGYIAKWMHLGGLMMLMTCHPHTGSCRWNESNVVHVREVVNLNFMRSVFGNPEIFVRRSHFRSRSAESARLALVQKVRVRPSRPQSPRSPFMHADGRSRSSNLTWSNRERFRQTLFYECCAH